MRSSYDSNDVCILLKDITGTVSPQDVLEREMLIQKGAHYSQMLPVEYKPTQQYMEIYQEALVKYAKPVALATGNLCHKILKTRTKKIVLVSLARAGIPVGILLKRYMKFAFDLEVPHYAISIIRDKGIDHNAMNYILKCHRGEEILFVDGWTGKGAILGQLEEAIEGYKGVSPQLAVLADPANLVELAGTYEDILIPSSCLNSTVSGLISRTFLRDDIIGPQDFHGAIYYGEMKDEDVSNDFIETITRYFEKNGTEIETRTAPINGYEESLEIAKEYGIENINYIKPSIGETTRVLLRRVPYRVIISEHYRGDDQLRHLVKLAREKNVPIVYRKMYNYKAVGIIKKLADV